MEKNDLKKRYEELLAEISSATPAGNTAHLLAVSKAQSFEKIKALYQLGHRDFGENYVQELEEKYHLAAAEGMSDIRWHMIGHLQKNKVKQVLPFVKSIHSVDSPELAEKISQVAIQQKIEQVPIYLQVNIDNEESKHGFTDVALRFFMRQVLAMKNLKVEGLMCIPRADRSSVKEPFRKMRALLIESRVEFGEKLGAGLSMGMSEDFEEAIQEGATVVRVGSSLFGARA